MSQRLQIVLPDPAAEQLHDLAAASDRPASTLAAQMVQRELTVAAETGTVRPARAAQQRARGGSGKRAAWLEPYGGSATWRAHTWGAIAALHARYPRALAPLKDGWWTDESHLETLCALAAWRAEIDDTGQDPREELAFQTQLTDYAHSLRSEGGGVTRTWTPAAPPDEWAF